MSSIEFNIFKDDEKGKILYIPEDQDVLVSFPNRKICSLIYSYLNNDILVKMPAAIPNEDVRGYYKLESISPTYSLQNMCIALSELYGNLGVYVVWNTTSSDEEDMDE